MKKTKRRGGIFSLWRRVAALEARLDALEEGRQREGSPLAPYVEDAGVPMALVIREYLWGKEEDLS